jgi:predicted O-methyltransferase YrrM
MHPDWQDEIHVYSENMSSPETPFLQAINEFTWKKMINPRMLSGHLQGRFLSSLVALKQPQCILEIGTFTGYATACLLEHLPQNASLHTIEADAETAHKTQKFWLSQHPQHRVNWHVGEALTLLPNLQLQPDFVFVDADKHNYKQYLDLCFPMLKPGGVLLFDNTLWSKRVTIEVDRLTDRDTQNMHAFNQYAKNTPNALVTLLPIRDGITLITKLI